jgi:TctA family transporter
MVFGSTFPVLNIAPLINEYSFILTPEHFLYLPIVGILIVVSSAADHFLKHFRKLILGHCHHRLSFINMVSKYVLEQ